MARNSNVHIIPHVLAFGTE